MRVRVTGHRVRRHAFDGRMRVEGMADRGHRGLVAAAHAGRPHDPDPGLERGLQGTKQRLGAGERAGERVADAHRHIGWACSPSMTTSKWA
jgi:hypothetical protein